MSSISVGRSLLLTNIKRDGLFIQPDSLSYLLVQIAQNGDHVISELTQNACRQVHISLRGVGERYLNLKTPSLNTVLKYLVTPEMEVERIFNCLRFKYLNAIYLSKFENPKQFITYKYNKAFQTLSGLTIYQGNPPQRRVNDSYWQDAGFTIEAKQQNWQQEHRDMQRIIAILKRISTQCLTRLYAELIAIKPGFHELYVHHNYFERSTMPRGKSPRDEVFRLLRNCGDILALSLDRLPAEINKNNYISYRLGLIRMLRDKIFRLDQGAEQSSDRFRVFLDKILLTDNVECFGINFAIVKQDSVNPELPLDLSQREVPGTDRVNLFPNDGVLHLFRFNGDRLDCLPGQID